MWLILCCCSSYVIQIQALVSPYCDTPTQRFLILPPTHHLLAVLAHKQFSYSGGKKNHNYIHFSDTNNETKAMHTFSTACCAFTLSASCVSSRQ